MDDALRRFVDRNALLMSQEGLARAAGLILGLLVVSDEPRSLEEMAEILDISKASVSLNTRLLERLGLIERVPGKDRRVYYQMAPDVWVGALEKEITPITSFMNVTREAREQAKELSDKVADRLAEMEAFYAFWAKEIPNVTARWQAEREGLIAATKASRKEK